MTSSNSSAAAAHHSDTTDKGAASTTYTGRNDVFISYSRKDKTFVESLDAAFRHINRDPWIDWNDIRKGEEWWKAIQRGIESAHTFIFVISPDSINSTVCRDEVNHAAECNKRFLPIVYREGFDTNNIHPAISSHNWLFFRETDDFAAAFQDLIDAIDTDLEHVQNHTRLLIRAIEWRTKDRHSSYLLRGLDLEDAEHWLIQSTQQKPAPTPLHIDYITASRNQAIAQFRSRQQARWIIILTIVLANMALVTGGCFWYFNYETQRTLQRVEENLIKALDVGTIGIDGDEFATLARLRSTTNSLPVAHPLYQKHHNWLYKVHTTFPNAYLRTYVRGAPPDEIRWIGDVSRVLNTSFATQFRQAYDTQNDEVQVYSGSVERIVTMTPFVDEFGNWVSASGPIRSSTGQIVGGLRVDFKEDYVARVQQQVRRRLLITYVVVLIWLLFLSLLVLRVTRPRDEGKIC